MIKMKTVMILLKNKLTNKKKGKKPYLKKQKAKQDGTVSQYKLRFIKEYKFRELNSTYQILRIFCKVYDLPLTVVHFVRDQSLIGYKNHQKKSDSDEKYAKI